MKSSKEENLKNKTYEKQVSMSNLKIKDEGITLVALVVTIIVLLILAGVALSSVLSQDGIFSRAEDATTKYGKEKSRETLELVLTDVRMMKYEERPDEETYNEKLDEQLNKIGQVNGEEKDEVTVDGHIWRIDRSVPKILDYIGPDDGIEVKYTITGNDTWIIGTPNIQVSVTVKNNKGALDINSIKVTKKVGNGSETDITSSTTINSNGTFTLTTTETTETIFTVSAKNSEGEQSTPRIIKVTPKIDRIVPILSDGSARADLMNIIIKVTATDNESGVKQINYSISPTTVNDSNGIAAPTGTLISGQELELTATKVGDYTVTFTATDEAENTTEPGLIMPAVTTRDTISVEEAKALVTSTSALRKYMGTKVSYKTGETWLIFYYDEGDEEHPEGYFKCGAGMLYLKKAYNSSECGNLSLISSDTSSVGYQMMAKMNPLWAESAYKGIDKKSEKACLYLCSPNYWNSKKNNTYSSWAIGCPSVEMFVRAYNIWKWGEPENENYVYSIGSEYGYSYKCRRF